MMKKLQTRQSSMGGSKIAGIGTAQGEPAAEIHLSCLFKDEKRRRGMDKCECQLIPELPLSKMRWKRWTDSFTKLDTSIEKITELNVSIREVLSVHEQRISTNEDEIERIDDVRWEVRTTTF